MGQQVLDGHRPGRRHALAGFVQHRHAGELRNELRDRVVERDRAFLDENHHRDAGERLGHRVDAEDVVRLEGVAGGGVAHAGRLPVDDLPAPGDQGHHTGQPPVVDVGPHGGTDAGEAFGGHPGALGNGRGESGVRGERARAARLAVRIAGGGLAGGGRRGEHDEQGGELRGSGNHGEPPLSVRRRWPCAAASSDGTRPWRCPRLRWGCGGEAPARRDLTTGPWWPTIREVSAPRRGGIRRVWATPEAGRVGTRR